MPGHEATPAGRGGVLVVDDDRGTVAVLQEALGHRGFSPRTAGNVREAMEALSADPGIEVVLTDLRMPGTGGMELLGQAAAGGSGVPVIVITAFATIRGAVEAMRRGAYDFQTKPYDLDLVALSLDRAVERRRTQLELERLRANSRGQIGDIIGDSPAIRRMLAMVERVASSDATVLVTGESGTGKDLVAQALHRQSGRASAPFVAVNCSAIPEALLESELFGHARGAFTDAREARSGLFQRAHGGTLFLDEIGDTPLSMQAKLLRAIQERKVRPVGSDREIPVDVRVVAATHRSLDDEVAAGRFRQDLLFRIQVIEIAVPPLRARGSDVIAIAEAVLERAAHRANRGEARLTADAARCLMAYDWPGNVRELQNCMERALALSRDGNVSDIDLPERVRHHPGRSGEGACPAFDLPGEILPLEEVERRYMRHVLAVVKGNKRLAAQLLGVDRSTLYRRLSLYDKDGTREGDGG